MFWSWLYAERYGLLAPINKYLHRHVRVVFRALLLGGDLFALAIFWYMQPFFPHQRTYDLWLAGFTATLVILFMLTMGSARLNGYRPYHDRWIRLAAVFMLLLCLTLGLSTVL